MAIALQSQNRAVPDPSSTKRSGMVHIYTGDGKGKTTAAIGLAARALGRGFRVHYTGMLKRADASGELMTLEKFVDFTHTPDLYPLPPVTKVYDMAWCSTETCKLQWTDAMSHIMHVDMLIIDEIFPAIRNGFFDPKLLRRLIDSKPKSLELVLTGRGASKDFYPMVDYVTEMNEISHPFRGGMLGRRGIEY